MFRSALVKLTGLYLMILLIVSVLFSVSLYRISTQEVNNRLRRQVNFLQGRPILGPGFDLRSVERQRDEEIDGTKRAIALQLLYVDILVLLAGGAGSYWLAKKTLQPIEEAHEAQARFVADASHELRTPIAAMRLETEVGLRDKKLTVSSARALLKSNVEELERLTVLSEGLLQLARGKSNTRHSESLEVTDIVTNAMQQTAPAAKLKNIELVVQKSPATKIHGNETQLVQLLVILINNAISYSSDKQRIRIAWKIAQGQLILTVADKGYGISEKDLPHIFERFYRADQSRSSSNVPGNGLGLSITQQIVEQHGGNIHVTSMLGEGSIFSVTLPLQT